MTKIYNMLAIWKDENGAVQATKVAEGPADELVADIGLMPRQTHRIAVMEKKKFDALLSTSEARLARDVASASEQKTSDGSQS